MVACVVTSAIAQNCLFLCYSSGLTSFLICHFLCEWIHPPGKSIFLLNSDMFTFCFISWLSLILLSMIIKSKKLLNLYSLRPNPRPMLTLLKKHYVEVFPCGEANCSGGVSFLWSMPFSTFVHPEFLFVIWIYSALSLLGIFAHTVASVVVSYTWNTVLNFPLHPSALRCFVESYPH